MASASAYHLKEMNMTLKNTSTNIFLKIVVGLLLFSVQINAQYKILNNGQRRIGSGNENSINAQGNMQQPFYFNSTNGWTKLTYSALPLDIKWGVGGVGTNNWNINGSMVENPSVTSPVANTNPSYDYSGFTITSGSNGTGVIKWAGKITIGTQLFLVENTYTLGATDGFFRIKTKITNLDPTTTATNVRLWVGTRDDWIGATDQPTKERGNLINGVFTMIPNVTPRAQAQAIKVYSGNEAILMFSNSPRAYSSIRQYDGTFSVPNTDPSTNDITTTNDGQYVIYSRFNDLLPNQSDELDWYYAAGTLAQINEIILAVAQAASSVQNITYNSASYSYSASQSGTTSYVLVPSGSTVPTTAQIEAGVSYTGGTVVSSSSIATTANQANTYNFTGLNPNTAYTVYAVTKYFDGANNVFTSIQTTNFTTLFQPPTISNFNNITKMYNDVPFTIVAPTSNSAGSFTYTSSDTSVATISGNTITILRGGTSTITATQAANGNFLSGTTTATLTVSYDPPIFTFNPSTYAQTMCAGSASLTVTANGGGDAIASYSWYKNSNSSNTGGTLVGGPYTSTATTHSFSPTDAGAFYYYATCTTAGGLTATSGVSGQITVNALPVISSQPSASTQAICINGTATALSVTATAGSGTLYRYKWYSNATATTTGGTLEATTLSTTTTNTYTPDTTVSGTKYYYAEVTNSNGCSLKSTVSGAVTINPLSVGGTASSSNLFMASGGQPTISLTGNTGTIVWQKSTDGLTGWTSATGAGTTAQTFVSSAVAATTFFRALVTSGGCTAEASNVIKITITTTPITSTGTVSSVCNSASAQTTTMPYTASAGSPNSYSIDWDYTANNAGLTDQGATTYSFLSAGGNVTGIVIPAGLAVGFYYGVMTVTNGTGTSTLAIKIAIGSISGSISGGTSVIIGTNSTVLTLDGYAGAIVWQSSTDNTTFTPISGATSTTYTATNLTSTTFYRVVVTNGSCPAVTSSTANITVMPNSNRFGIYGSSTANTISNNVATVVDDTIIVNSNGSISGFTVTITSDYTDGDVLSYRGTLPSGITAAAFNPTSRSLTFTGTTSAINWQNLLRTVTLKSTSACFPTNRRVSFLPSDKFFNLFNGHFYEYVSTLQSWTSAKSAAAAKSYYGRQGYLVTISSEAENSYLNTLIARNTWIGATDNAVQINSAFGYTKYSTQMLAEGNYHWVTGPEKGTQMRNGNAQGTVLKPGNNIAGVYNQWAAGEPNEWPFNQTPGDEDYGHLYADGRNWNDYDNGKMFASIVEYGGLSTDDISDNVTFTRNIIISGSPSGTISGAAPVCSGTNTTTLTYSGGGTIVRWEYSLDNFLTAGIVVSATTSSITVNDILIPRYYRVIVNSGVCNGLSSSVALIDINYSVAGNITSDNSTICSGGNAILALNGNNGSIVKWQYSTVNDFSSSVNDINVTTTTIIHPIGATGTYYFRAVVQNSNCSAGGSVYSEAYPVTVITGVNPVGGTINNVTYCGGSNSGTLTLSGSVGSSYQWEFSNDGLGVVWNTASSTSTTLNYTGIANTTKYRVKVTNGSCGYIYSAIGTITVNESFAVGTISGNTTLYSMTNSSTITLSDYVGTVQWQSSLNGSTYTNIASATGATYTATNLNATTFFRALVTNGSCLPVASNFAKITMAVIIVPATLTNFVNETKTVFDGSYVIIAPTSNNLSGAFTYASSNTNIATINGTTVSILAPGTTTITATQAENGPFSQTTISAVLTVLDINVLNKNGKLSNSDFNYVNKNGALTKIYGLGINGTLIAAKSVVSVGDSYRGGKVAYILQEGDTGYDPAVQHGLIASTSDLSSGIKWSNVTNTITSATGTAIGTGLANTNTINTNQGATLINYAAGLARSYAGGGFSDWYLPSKDELNKLYLNKVAIGGFTGTFYWSSTEGSTSSQNLNYAWGQFFTNGLQQDYDNTYGAKTTLQSVRAVRSF